MTDAISYEHLLRRIYQVGRYGTNNVNADIYRALERSERLYHLEIENIENKQIRLSTKNIDDLAYDYRVECRKVWSILETAITHGISKNRDIFTADEIYNMEKSIIEPKVVIKEHIDNIINTAEQIYINHNIYPA